MHSLSVWVHSINGIGGQASITRSAIVTAENLGLRVNIIEYGAYGFFPFIISVFRIVFSKSDIYFPASRSFWGAFRDLPIYVLSIFGRRVITHIHGSDFTSLFHHSILGRLLTTILNKRVIIIVTNYLSKTDLENLGCGRVFCVENFFPSEYLNLDCNHKNPKTFFWNSNIIATKGIFEFLDAFVDYTHRTGASLRIAGEILGCKKMTKYETKLKLESYLINSDITYIGACSRFATLQELIKAEVCVLTSYSESQPLALIDGMCCGCQIICSDLAELREMTNDYPMVCYTKVSRSSILEVLLGKYDFAEFNPKMSSEAARRRFSEDLFSSKLKSIFVER
ncbi:glycosyltransferase [Amylibacter sp.]|nr:glycosyltransferase [Amylibacter sp.]